MRMNGSPVMKYEALVLFSPPATRARPLDLFLDAALSGPSSFSKSVDLGKRLKRRCYNRNARYLNGRSEASCSDAGHLPRLNPDVEAIRHTFTTSSAAASREYTLGAETRATLLTPITCH